MARLLLVGASHEILVLAESLGHQVVAVVDPGCGAATWCSRPVYRTDREAIDQVACDSVALAIDEPERRRRAHLFYAKQGFAAATLVGGLLGEETRHGEGLVLQRLGHVSVDCELGTCVRVNVGANVMHDARIGDYVSLAPNAVVCGRVTIGALCYIGANATILPKISIGARCMVGAGAVVTRDVSAGRTVKGNPAV